MRNKKYFILTKGNDTDFIEGVDFLTIYVNSQVSLTGCRLEFSLGSFVKSFNDLSQPLVVNMDADDFTCLPVGENYGEIKVYNASGKVMTWNNRIPFFVGTEVADCVCIADNSMTFNIMVGGENTIEINVKTPSDKKVVSGSVIIPEIESNAVEAVSVVFSDTLKTNSYQAVVSNATASLGWANLKYTLSDKTTTGFTINVMNTGTGASAQTSFDYIVVE